MVEILPEAVKKIKSLQAEAGVATVLSLTIDIGGPSGVHPAVSLDSMYLYRDDDYKQDYLEQEVAGIQMIIEKRYAKYVEDLVIDYHEGLDRSGFVISRKVKV